MSHGLGIPALSSSSAAALEVLRLLGFMVDMWSRHRDSLHQIMASTSSSEEDKEDHMPQQEAMMSMVERMEVELREQVRELWSSPSSCSGLPAEESPGTSHNDENDMAGQMKVRSTLFSV